MIGSIEALKTNKMRCVPILTPDRIDSKPKLIEETRRVTHAWTIICRCIHQETRKGSMRKGKGFFKGLGRKRLTVTRKWERNTEGAKV